MNEWYEERLSFTFPLWFDMGHEMCLAVGNTMLKWADNLHGFPPDMTPEKWESLLRIHGEALRDYGLDYLDEEEDIDKAIENDCRREERAKDALRWVAENLETMWD